MINDTLKQKRDSSDKTVIDLNGSEQHHDLKNKPGNKGDADHNKPSGDTKDTVEDN